MLTSKTKSLQVLLAFCKNVCAELDLTSCTKININLHFLWFGSAMTKTYQIMCTSIPKKFVKETLCRNKPFTLRKKLAKENFAEGKLTHIYLAQNLLKKPCLLAFWQSLLAMETLKFRRTKELEKNLPMDLWQQKQSKTTQN